MRPAGAIKNVVIVLNFVILLQDYAKETPLTKSSSDLEGEMLHEVKIDFNPDSEIAAINSVLKNEETGSWYQHRGMDFKVPILDYLHHGINVVGAKRGFEQKYLLLNSEISGSDMQNRRFEGFYEEYAIVKEVPVDNTLRISVNKCPETAKNNLYLETDIPEDVVVHSGVCRGQDFRYASKAGGGRRELERGFWHLYEVTKNDADNAEASVNVTYLHQVHHGEKSQGKTKEAQESILQEIEKLAAEAYSIFKSSIPTFTEATVVELETQKLPVKFFSETGIGFEILCQGFNCESHKSGRWSMELYEKAEELSSLGFTVV
ncbi:hypothetical protein RJ641_035966 [Dillenia turbinata]|uniref:Alpha-glucan water dikinase-like N-terminal Ig-like domain-containing protein n=1 Tax=Dillenia turbinata TaxID=194707 RepID=A0AAN8VTD0_9MAGN